MTVKASKILKKVLKLGKDHPKKQASCVYFHSDGKPCCIVGRAMAKAGVDPAPFLEDNNLNQWTPVDELLTYRAGELGIENDLGMADYARLKKIQAVQDDGKPWGEAIKARG